MRQWTGSALVQLMACRMFCAKPLPNRPNVHLLLIGHLRTNFSDIFIKCKLFIQENAFQNVICEIAAILSREKWVKNKRITRIMNIKPSAGTRHAKSVQHHVMRCSNQHSKLHRYLCISMLHKCILRSHMVVTSAVCNTKCKKLKTPARLKSAWVGN